MYKYLFLICLVGCQTAEDKQESKDFDTWFNGPLEVGDSVYLTSAPNNNMTVTKINENGTVDVFWIEKNRGSLSTDTTETRRETLPVAGLKKNRTGWNPQRRGK